jgi:hypothetical protein
MGLQHAVERSEGDQQVDFAGQSDVDLVGDEHVVADQHADAVQPHLGEGREAGEAQGAIAVGDEARAVPDVAVMQGRRLVVVPFPSAAQRFGGRAWHDGRHPVESRWQQCRIAGGIGCRDGQLPPIDERCRMTAGDGDDAHQPNLAPRISNRRS